MFNDSKPLAVRTIKENIVSLKEEKISIVIQKDYLDAIKKISQEAVKFDIVFLDPPYKLNIYEDVMNLLLNHLNPNGLIVAEMEKERLIELEKIEAYEFFKERIYGSKKINYFIKK